MARAPILECGHRHRLWYPLAIPAGFPRRWVVTEALPLGPLILEADTELRLDQTDGVLQGCAGCEDFIVWSRFYVLSGAGAGQCVEFMAIDPWRSEMPVIPPQLAARLATGPEGLGDGLHAP